MKLKKTIALGVASVLALNVGVNIGVKKGYESKVKVNSMNYKDEIKKYNDRIMDYAAYINSLDLTDLEIIMKVMKDIWSEIDGYGECENLIYGYYRLSFQQEGRGVCINLADDFTAKINAINPKFNAKNIIVYEKEGLKDYVVDRVNIERTVLENVEVDVETLKNQRVFGNHMVSVIDIDEYNLKLVVDVTKLLIGVLRNGKIEILNSSEKDLMDYKFNSSVMFSEESYIDLYKDYFDTYDDVKITDEEIDEMYGIDAQRCALEKVKNYNDYKKLVKTNIR